MDEIGAVSPELMRAMVEDFRRRQQLQPHIQQNFPQRRPIDEVSPHRVFVLNTEEEVIPPYACMRVTGVEIVGGQTCIKVEKPSSIDGEFLFNSPYEIPVAGESSAGVGWAYRYGQVVMKGNETPPTEANVKYQPVVDSWEIEEGGGPFVVFGSHNVGTNTLIGRFAGGSPDGGIVLCTPTDVVPGIGFACDGVVAEVLYASCGSGLSPGDSINVFDINSNWLRMPASILFGGVVLYVTKLGFTPAYGSDTDCNYTPVSAGCTEDIIPA